MLFMIHFPHDERNSEISALTDAITQNTRRVVKAEIEIVVEKLATATEREVVDKSSGKGGREYRELNALSRADLADAKAVVSASDKKMMGLKERRKTQKKIQNIIKKKSVNYVKKLLKAQQNLLTKKTSPDSPTTDSAASKSPLIARLLRDSKVHRGGKSPSSDQTKTEGHQEKPKQSSPKF